MVWYWKSYYVLWIKVCVNYVSLSAAACEGDEFVCSGNTTMPMCVTAASVCDGTPSCPDASDEADCGESQLNFDQTKHITDGSSSSVFDVMGASTSLSLPWVPHTWMSGTDLLQTPRAWFWGTHKWAISATLLNGRVSRIAGNVVVLGPFLLMNIKLRSLCQSLSNGCSSCRGMFWGKRWWSVGVVAVDEVCPGFGCILHFCCGRCVHFIMDKSFGFSVRQLWWGLLLFSSFASWCAISVPVMLVWDMDTDSRNREKDPDYGDEKLQKTPWHLIQRTHYERRGSKQNPASHWTLQRTLDHCETMQAAVVWAHYKIFGPCQDISPGHCARWEKKGQTEKTMGR